MLPVYLLFYLLQAIICWYFSIIIYSLVYWTDGCWYVFPFGVFQVWHLIVLIHINEDCIYLSLRFLHMRKLVMSSRVVWYLICIQTHLSFYSSVITCDSYFTKSYWPPSHTRNLHHDYIWFMHLVSAVTARYALSITCENHEIWYLRCVMRYITCFYDARVRCINIYAILDINTYAVHTCLCPGAGYDA